MRGQFGSVVVLGLFVAALLAGCITAPPDLPPGESEAENPAIRNAVVIAVVDSAFNPYHWDFLAAHMPQHLDDDPANDIPLERDPVEWLRGHPGGEAFASYTRLDLTLTPDDADAVPADLRDADSAQWDQVQRSDRQDVHMHYIPGTKVVGYVNFGGGSGFAASSHGTGVSSVSVGNIYGACPECLLVFVNGPSEMANDWVLQQDWIDIQTNSWGLSLVMRDRLYAGSDTVLQRAATERGQSIFFSAGNGQANTFTVPNTTLWSSQEGPDWIVTVGAVDPVGHRSYSGHGKPADISNLGSAYPSMGGSTVTAESTFGGTSNATPVTAGIYGRALWLLREELDGAGRMQADGVLASGSAGCGDANPDCALADGALRVEEIREALYRSAEYGPDGWAVGIAGAPVPVETEEMRLLAEGHGSMYGRMAADWKAESERVQGYVNGTWFVEQDAAQRDYMIALSYCRQVLWGEWEHGYWNPDVALPAAHPEWPMRSWFVDECARSGQLLHDVVSAING